MGMAGNSAGSTWDFSKEMGVTVTVNGNKTTRMGTSTIEFPGSREFNCVKT